MLKNLGFFIKKVLGFTVLSVSVLICEDRRGEEITTQNHRNVPYTRYTEKTNPLHVS